MNTLEVDVGRVSNDVVLIFDDENESIFGFRPRNQIDFIPDLYVDFSGLELHAAILRGHFRKRKKRRFENTQHTTALRWRN